MGRRDMTSPTFMCRFRDVVVTKMTTHCAADNLDLRRGIVLSRLAYQSRTKGKHPPPIVGAYFQTLGGDVLCEYDDKTIKQIEGA
jgi:hypothetical protein